MKGAKLKLSQNFFRTFKEKPKEVDNISTELLLRANFIDKEASGIYSILPLGWKVMQKISQIIREEMDKIGGQEFQMPALQPKELWIETGRWDKIDPPLFKFKDRHNKELTIGPTHEEVITDIVRDRVSSFRDLPFMLYQIQAKFRNEQRSSGGLLRVREFLMKDAYSFHADEEEFDKYYKMVIEAYKKIYERCGTPARLVEAHSGSIGGKKSNEFLIVTPQGESNVYVCGGCDWAATDEVVKNVSDCPKCNQKVKLSKAIEVGHIFMLGDLYSQKMNAKFTDQNGDSKNIIMGCYGIGVGRLLSTIIEKSHDEKGMIWPKEVSPYQIHLISLDQNEKADEIYQNLVDKGFDVLYDDRTESAGVKFADADLIGITARLTVSKKTLEQDSVELKMRDKEENQMLKIAELEEAVKKVLE